MCYVIYPKCSSIFGKRLAQIIYTDERKVTRHQTPLSRILRHALGLLNGVLGACVCLPVSTRAMPPQPRQPTQKGAWLRPRPARQSRD